VEDTPHNETHIQTESKKLENDLPRVQKPKASSSYSYIRQNRFCTKVIKKDEKGHYMLIIKGTIQQEDREILNIYASNINAPKFIKWTPLSLKGQIRPDTIIVGDINNPLSLIDRTSRPKNQQRYLKTK
jgi:hypothetical protein